MITECVAGNNAICHHSSGIRNVFVMTKPAGIAEVCLVFNLAKVEKAETMKTAKQTNFRLAQHVSLTDIYNIRATILLHFVTLLSQLYMLLNVNKSTTKIHYGVMLISNVVARSFGCIRDQVHKHTKLPA